MAPFHPTFNQILTEIETNKQNPYFLLKQTESETETEVLVNTQLLCIFRMEPVKTVFILDEKYIQ